ncbi:MAG: tetratricopeptide repeat protein [Mycobacteriales bacterium]
MVATEQEDLTARLRRFPVDRYPVQHATTQFHLGSERLHAGDANAALASLTAASEVFEQAGMRLEQAKAYVMLGIGLRTAQRHSDAVAVFVRAETTLAGLGAATEQAAAAYNLGLVHQDTGELPAAYDAWQRARDLFLAAGYPAQAAAAARDHGAALLDDGQPHDALPLLQQALDLADRGGDEVGVGAAANVLGLAHLALGDPTAAVEALRRSLGAFPRAVRPGDHAMVKANLALAHEQAGNDARARLAARQALALAAPPPVRVQAQELLVRLATDDGDDLWLVLDDEAPEAWPLVLREELLRAVDLGAGPRTLVVGSFLQGLLDRPGPSYELAESFLHVVLELPPRSYGQLIDAVVASCAVQSDPAAERLRSVLGSAMARFAMPQWQRLAASLNDAAQAAGQPATWR